MKTQLVITDVTRMREGRVCIAGHDRNRRCFRPVSPAGGIQEATLYSKGRPIVFPFAVVQFDLVKHIPDPPHTEDWSYDPRSVSFVQVLNEKEKRETLEKLLFPNVAAIFEAPVHADYGRYVLAGQGCRSLGTIRPAQILTLTLRKKESGWDYRLEFIDAEEGRYPLKITDLACRYLCDSQLRNGHSADEVSTTLTKRLQSSEVYLRVGLARHWDEFPDRCFLQLTGIYTFPDYLEGKTFADLAPAAN